MASMAEPNRGPSVLIVTTLFCVLATIFVALRMISRIGIVKKVDPDDYVMLLAWVIAFCLSFSICYGTAYGLGQHQSTIPASHMGRLKRAEYAFSVLYNPSLMVTKTSILLFYLKLGATELIFRWACYATLSVVNLAGLALTFLNIFQCRPIGAVFKTPVPENAYCENIVTLYLSSAPVNIITDLAILFLPMPILTSMRLPRKQKNILIVTFSVGFFVTVIDVIRIAYLQDAATARIQALLAGGGNDPGQRNNSDISWYASLSFMWSGVEANMGIMCGCVPMLKPLVSRFMPQLLRDINVKNLSNSKSRLGSENKNDSSNGASSRAANLAEIMQPKELHLEPAEASCSSTSHGAGEEIEPAIGVLDFLTTPEMKELPQRDVTNSGAIKNPVTRNDYSTFFDFVNMQQRKSLVEMTLRESLFPNIMVTILFVIWGVAYGFLDTLNTQFQQSANMTPGQTTALHSAYFGGYFVAPLTFGRLCLKKWGFKACYIVGLCTYACGTLVFWPSAVLTSFPAFLVSNFIVGMGLSTLEISANPFIALCGPQKYMEVRLNLSQSVQAVGTVVSPLLAQKVLFKSATNASSLVDVQWTYLGIALFSILLAVAYFYVPLPEATDAQLERAQARRSDYANIASISGVRILWISLTLGVLSEFAYVGAQESVSTSFNAFYAEAFHSHNMDTTSWLAIAHTAFAVSRFLTAGLNCFIKARYLLLFFYAAAVALSAVCMTYSGVTAQTALILLFACEGPIFSIIFASSLRGLGKHTKDASALITAAISGGASWPPIMYGIATKTHRSYQYGYCVIIAAFATGMLLPIWQNIHPVARKLADPMPDDEDFMMPVHSSSSGMRSSSFSRPKAIFKNRRRKEGISGVEHVEEVHRHGTLSRDLPHIGILPGTP
ncbi:uncharacterized protein PV09_09055 [Verruconis gallopava]|uniref:Rhodopsin domain-containing protein n=1 Tax=Verruconis gallopava TaxID=253628 RepID=A0A0D1ZXU5_9PEZI|nr:uncharacterized protein PV09_09055 [Verruconis gallopava]KIV99287.1 hypothetical protein PV09_09055 [Verruconis gallopava]